MVDNATTPPLVTPDVLADELGVPVATLTQWRYLGNGPSYLKVGRYVRYRRSDINTWLTSRTRRTRAAV